MTGRPWKMLVGCLLAAGANGCGGDSIVQLGRDGSATPLDRVAPDHVAFDAVDEPNTDGHAVDVDRSQSDQPRDTNKMDQFDVPLMDASYVADTADASNVLDVAVGPDVRDASDVLDVAAGPDVPDVPTPHDVPDVPAMDAGIGTIPDVSVTTLDVSLDAGSDRPEDASQPRGADAGDGTVVAGGANG